MIGKNNDQNLPPINLSNTDKPATNKKSTRKTESILARMPKVRTTTGQSKLGLFDRLRNLSKKDFAYLAAASGVVITLPFAEHYMVKPEATPRVSAFSTNPSRGNSSGAGEVFEPGNGAFAPGGAPGGSSDVVTPLSARDPSSLIIGPGDGQQAQVIPLQQTPPPSTPAPVKDSPITSAVRAGASSANNTAAGPFIPSSKLQAHIRGLESVSGGGKASAGELWGGKVLQTAKSVPNTAAVGSSVAPKAMSGYNGVARSRTSSGSNSAMEDLKRGASNAADYLNGRNAVQSLDRAADASVYAGGTNTGGGPGGGPGEGQGYKGAGVNNLSGAAQRSAGKESLEAELARTKAMAELQRQIKWKDYLKLELPKMIIDTMAKAIMEPIGKAIGSKVSDALSGPPSSPLYYTCICVTEKCGPIGSVAVSVPYNKDKDYAEYTKPEGRSCSVGKKVETSTAANPSNGTNPNGGPAAVPGSTAKKTGIAKYDEKFANGARAGDAKSLEAYARAQKAITDSCATAEACAAAKGELQKYFDPSNVSELAGQYSTALKEHQAVLAQGYLEDDVNQVAQNAAAVSFNTPINTVQSVFDDGEIVKYIKDCGQANPVASKEICSAVNNLPASARDYATIQGNIETAKKAYQDGTSMQSSIASAAARFSGGKAVSSQLLTQAEEKLTSEAPAALQNCTDVNSCLAALNLLGQPSALGETTVASAYPLRKGDFRCAVESASVFSLMKRARGTMDDFKTEAGLKTFPAVSGDYSEYSGVALYAVMKQNYETLYGNAETYNKVQMPALSQAAAAYTKLKEEIKKVTDKANEAEKQNAALKQDQEALAQQQAKLAAEQRRQADEQRRQAAEQRRQSQELAAQRRKYNSLSVQQKQTYCQQNAGNALISVQICNHR